MNSSNNLKNIKNWIILDKFIQSPNSIIYNIRPIIDNTVSAEDEKDLLSSQWVIKVSPDNVENSIVEELKLYENELFIKMPKNNIYRNNESIENNWYIMEKCDSCIGKNYIFARKNIFELGNYVINFFEWLHIEKNKIYGDIKPNNIMINKKRKNPFVIIDYETILTPDLRYICDEKSYNNYYYFYIGCEYGKPFFSYRMDLESFGYILYALVLSTDSYYVFNWQKTAFTFYNNKIKDNLFGELIIQKEYTNVIIPNLIHKELINNYFEIIKEQKWEGPPNKEVYNKLKELFTIHQLKQVN